jgi:hypothetical protein
MNGGSVGGGLVGDVYNPSTTTSHLINDHASGNVAAGLADNGAGKAGGLAGGEGGPSIIQLCYATGTASVGAGSNDDGFAFVGGLVGAQYALNGITGTIDQSFATGAAVGAPSAFVGGIVGYTDGAVTNSYATAATLASGSGFTALGGAVGYLDTGGSIGSSYSTGQVQQVAGSWFGGFVGGDTGLLSNDYWDTTTSGLNNGAGNIANAPGVTGDTTAQLQSGLPSGFSNSIWGESANVNGGLPYLLANPPA